MRIVPSNPPTTNQWKPSLTGLFLAFVFISLFAAGLFLIASDQQLIKHQFALGFLVLAFSSIPAFFFLKSQKTHPLKPEQIAEAMAHDSILRAKDTNSKDPP